MVEFLATSLIHARTHSWTGHHSAHWCRGQREGAIGTELIEDYTGRQSRLSLLEEALKFGSTPGEDPSRLKKQSWEHNEPGQYEPHDG